MSYGDQHVYPPEEGMTLATLLMYVRCKITMNAELAQILLTECITNNRRLTHESG